MLLPRRADVDWRLCAQLPRRRYPAPYCGRGLIIKSMHMISADLTIRAAQQQVDQWIKTKGVRYFSELTNLAILTEEVGEVARLISRLYGDQSFKGSDDLGSLPD